MTVAVVTGGTRGIGRAISLRLAREGVTVVMVYRRDDQAAETALLQARALQADAQIEKLDVSDAEAVDAFAARISATHGGAEIVVHAAFRSGRPARKTHEVSAQQWREDLDTNLTSAFLVSRGFLPAMIERNHGRIVLIGSLAMRGERGRVAYSVAKNGLVGLARTMAQEYARNGITANVVSPGFIDAGAFLNLDPAIKEAARKMVPSRTLGSGAQVADAVWYLVRPEAGYTTGQVIAVDGGAR
jgi:3-oxoacyl-[acyl-carrier protein] reductase